MSGVVHSSRLARLRFWRQIRIERLIEFNPVFPEGEKVASIVVRGLAFPTAKQDALPLEGECAQSRELGLAPIELILVEEPSPSAKLDGAFGKLDHRLVHKTRPCSPEM